MDRSMPSDAGASQAPSLPSDRSVGLVFGAAALVVAWLWRTSPGVTAGAVCVASLLAAISLLAPRLLRPLNIVWFRFGMLLHTIMNPVVMLALYAVAIVPAGLLMQRLRDPLRLKKPPTPTYWLPADRTPAPPPSMRNQF